MWVSVTPACSPSQMARSFIRISNEGWDLGWYTAQMELRILLLLGAGSLLMFTSEAYWLASPNSCRMNALSGHHALGGGGGSQPHPDVHI